MVFVFIVFILVILKKPDGWMDEWTRSLCMSIEESSGNRDFEIDSQKSVPGATCFASIGVRWGCKGRTHERVVAMVWSVSFQNDQSQID
jgi:hypothetical protein